MKKYHKKLGENLFCNDFVMGEAISHTYQFLTRLNKEIDFDLWYEKLIEAYKGKGSLGAPSYNPVIIFKMLFLAYLFNQKEREIERAINDSISMKGFLGLALDRAAPNHSSITKFKNRLLGYREREEKDILKEIFDEIIMLAQEKGINLGHTQVIDSTHTVADVNHRKEDKRTKSKEEDNSEKPPRDPDAKWGVKRRKTIKTSDGKKVQVNESYLGFKSHFAVDAINNLITSYKTTAMNYPDNYGFLPLLLDDIAKGVAKPGETIYSADRAYDDGELHVWLNKYRLKDAISLKNVKEHERLDGKKIKVRWKQYTSQEAFEEGGKKRYVVERVNADCKKYHGLGRANYLGLPKMEIQTVLTAMAHNLKTLVKLFTGVGLKTYSTRPITSVS